VPFVEGKTKQFWERERRKTLLPLFLCSAAWRGRKIFGPKSDRVTREWRRPHNEELNDPCCSSNIIPVT
jgi:hypothetical protein